MSTMFRDKGDIWSKEKPEKNIHNLSEYSEYLYCK